MNISNLDGYEWMKNSKGLKITQTLLKFSGVNVKEIINLLVYKMFIFNFERKFII
jgi:hypothetical protein